MLSIWKQSSLRGFCFVWILPRRRMLLAYGYDSVIGKYSTPDTLWRANTKLVNMLFFNLVPECIFVVDDFIHPTKVGCWCHVERWLRWIRSCFNRHSQMSARQSLVSQVALCSLWLSPCKTTVPSPRWHHVPTLVHCSDSTGWWQVTGRTTCVLTATKCHLKQTLALALLSLTQYGSAVTTGPERALCLRGPQLENARLFLYQFYYVRLFFLLFQELL